MSFSERRAAPVVVRALCAVVVLFTTAAAVAATYTAPSGYLQVIAYKLQRVPQDGGAGLAVGGWVEALADCRGALLLFDVLDRGGRPVGTIRISHGAFFRHDRWDLGPGEFSPHGDRAAALVAAARVEVRSADCTG